MVNLHKKIPFGYSMAIIFVFAFFTVVVPLLKLHNIIDELDLNLYVWAFVG